MGDFNLIYRVSDKSNDRVNRGLMIRFRWLLDDIEMKEIHMHDFRFTWSNGTQSPTQSKIDHVFARKEWELIYPNCPMILSCSQTIRRYKGFRFESFWL
jgi:hypothetical protein